jgi:hypothetical protein
MALPIVGVVANEVLSIGKSIIERMWPDPAKQAEAELRLIELNKNGELRDLEVRLSAIIEEAKSADPWTSRSRPSFLYVIYLMILASIPMGILHSISPETSVSIAEGMRSWLNSIPEALWTLFGAGYLGYTTARSYDKSKRLEVTTK